MRREKALHEVAADDLLVETNPVLFTRMESILVDTCTKSFGAQVIDTTERNISEIANLIVGMAEKQLPDVFAKEGQKIVASDAPSDNWRSKFWYYAM